MGENIEGSCSTRTHARIAFMVMFFMCVSSLCEARGRALGMFNELRGIY